MFSSWQRKRRATKHIIAKPHYTILEPSSARISISWKYFDGVFKKSVTLSKLDERGKVTILPLT